MDVEVIIWISSCLHYLQCVYYIIRQTLGATGGVIPPTGATDLKGHPRRSGTPVGHALSSRQPADSFPSP